MKDSPNMGSAAVAGAQTSSSAPPWNILVFQGGAENAETLGSSANLQRQLVTI